MKIYKKLHEAKSEIKATKMKKEGFNKFSNYNYFTPEQVELLVFDACTSQGLATFFQLRRNEFGEFGILSVVDTETSELVNFEMSTAIPDITATNVAQQIGGCMTYTERYLKMSVFGIVENSLDFDDKDHSKKKSKPEAPTNTPDDGKEWLNPGTDKWDQATEWLKNGGSLDAILQKYKLSKANKELLLTQSI